MTLRVWDVESGRCVRILEGHSSDIRAVAIAPDGRLAVSGGWDLVESKDNTLRVWDVERGQCLHELPGHREGIRALAISPDGRLAVTGSSDFTLRVWDLGSGRCLRVLERNTLGVQAVLDHPGLSSGAVGKRGQDPAGLGSRERSPPAYPGRALR